MTPLQIAIRGLQGLEYKGFGEWECVGGKIVDAEQLAEWVAALPVNHKKACSTRRVKYMSEFEKLDIKVKLRYLGGAVPVQWTYEQLDSIGRDALKLIRHLEDETSIAIQESRSIMARHEELAENYRSMVDQRMELLEAIKAAMRIEALWCPKGKQGSAEHEEEAAVLHKMRDMFIAVINKTEASK